MNIDFKKLGYRWRGYYDVNQTYADKDVVFKEGAAFAYDSLTQNFKIFARGHEEALSKGEIIVGGDIDRAIGNPGEYLYVREGKVKFEHPIDRNGTKVVRLGQKADCWMGNIQYMSHYYGVFIMSDGSVRAIGRTWEGQLGQGDQKDEGHGYWTPIRINYPQGSPAQVKAFPGYDALHTLDAKGQLWGAGNEWAGWSTHSDYFTDPGGDQTEQRMTNVGEHSDIKDAKIVDVVKGLCQYSHYSVHYAIDDQGRVYSWGDNPNGVLGHGTTSACYKAKLIEFTKDIPIAKIGTDAHTVTGMIDYDGNLYTCGHSGYNWHGHHRYTFEKVHGLQGKCVEFTGQSNEGHWNHGHYLFSSVLLEDGRLYVRGNGFPQVGWGTPAPSTSNAFINDNHLVGKNIKRSFMKHGGYGMLVAQKFDGSWIFRGDNRWHMNSGGNSDISPANAEDWDTRTDCILNPDYYNNNLDRYVFVGSNINTNAIGLTKDGRAFVDGCNRVGQRGKGIYDVHWNIGKNWTVNNGDYVADLAHSGDDYMRIRDKIVDVGYAGYNWHPYNASYYDYLACYFLTDKGDVFATGSNHYGLNGSYTGGNAGCPQKIYF